MRRNGHSMLRTRVTGPVALASPSKARAASCGAGPVYLPAFEINALGAPLMRPHVDVTYLLRPEPAPSDRPVWDRRDPERKYGLPFASAGPR